MKKMTKTGCLALLVFAVAAQSLSTANVYAANIETTVETESEVETESNEYVNDDPEANRYLKDAAIENPDVLPFAETEKRIKAYGIDVSTWNKDINWKKVKADGVDFAIIRVGYRGYGTGKLMIDDYAIKNLKGAQAAGVKIGAYFFSTALNEEEAIEEAKFAIDILKDYDVTYPIVYDCEGYDNPDYRTYKLPKKQRTDNAIAFLNYVEKAGYTPMMYGSTSHLANDHSWETSRMDSLYKMWVAQYFYYTYDEDGNYTLYPSFESIEGRNTTYKQDYYMWQFSSQGKVDGISGNTDLNIEYYLEDETEDNTGDDTEDEIEENTVAKFVERLYTLVLGRKPDPVGLKDWTTALETHKKNAAEVATGFIFSDEFTKKKVSNEEYVEILYNTCLGRKSDKIGREEWLDLLNGGFSRRYVAKGFIESKEFSEICESYGVIRGNVMLTENRDMNRQVTLFVRRCYNVFLDREPDKVGLNNWTGIILKDKTKARTLPCGFAVSNEMTGKNLSDKEYIAYLYRGIFDREPDAVGLKFWQARLNEGWSRRKVCEGFTNSIEFTRLLARFGL